MSKVKYGAYICVRTDSHGFVKECSKTIQDFLLLTPEKNTEVSDGGTTNILQALVRDMEPFLSDGYVEGGSYFAVFDLITEEDGKLSGVTNFQLYSPNQLFCKRRTRPIYDKVSGDSFKYETPALGRLLGIPELVFIGGLRKVPPRDTNDDERRRIVEILKSKGV